MLVSGRSELSKNVFGYNSPQNWKERFFPDIANLTIMTASDNTVVTVALSAIQSDTVALFCGSVLIEYCRIAWIHVA